MKAESHIQQSPIYSDARTSRCSGVIGREARREADNSYAHADEVSKTDGPFYCPTCLSTVQHRECTDKLDHFYHLPCGSAVYGKKDKELHDQCSEEICAALSAAFPDGKWATERQIPANEKIDVDILQPDVSGRLAGQPIAIEIQHSAYTPRKIARKTMDYAKRKINVLWIVPLYSELENKPFRPRLFEKYLHSMYKGRVYYWVKGFGAMLQPVHLSPSFRFIETRSWFEPGGEEQTSGGFALPYKTIRQPLFGQRVDIRTDFSSHHRLLWKDPNPRKNIPEADILLDNLERWWSKTEYEETRAKIERASMPSYLESYDDWDDYDDAE